MKVYFTSSARGTNKYGKLYNEIYSEIIRQGHTHTSDYSQDSNEQEIYSANQSELIKLHQESIRNIKSADVLVLEVSTHSLSMGFILQFALMANMPVIALYLQGEKPAFAVGVANKKLQVLEYKLATIGEVLTKALANAKSQSDVRFEFFISPEISLHLTEQAREKGMPKAAYVRGLIENDMQKIKPRSQSG